MTHSKGAMEAAQRTFERSCEKILDTVVSDNRMRALAELISTHTHDTELAEALWKSSELLHVAIETIKTSEVWWMDDPDKGGFDVDALYSRLADNLELLQKVGKL